MEVENKFNMVVYSDGSCKPNPGFIGYGVHAYTYDSTVPKKNYGGKGQRLTPAGYKLKESKEEDAPTVTPIKVYDIIGSSTAIGSNNTAEILGAKAGLKLALQESVKKVLIKTDSQYVCRGFNEWLDKWAKNNWINREGRYIANLNNWQEIYKTRDELRQNGIEVVMEWVKGHIGHPGNEKADKLANIGRINSEAKKESSDTHVYSAETYWNKNMAAEKNPLICKPWMYFRGLKEGQIPGEYYLGNIGKDKDFLGKRDANGAYGIVILKQPEVILEKVKEIQIKRFGSDTTIYVVNLRGLYLGERASDLFTYGASTLVQHNPRRRDLYFIDTVKEETKEEVETDEDDNSITEDSATDEAATVEPLTREQRPQKLAARVFDCLTFMKGKLVDYSSGDQRINTYFDITNEFFDTETKLVKKESVTKFKFKNDIKVGTITRDIDIQYDGIDLPIRLSLNIDCPDRNSLKRLETFNPKIVLVVWKESATSIRYATVIECDGALSIWCGFYSNLIFLPTSLEKEQE